MSLSATTARATACRIGISLLALTATATGAAAATAAPAATPKQIRPAQLAQMVLPIDLLSGGRFDVLQPSVSSGPLTVDDAPRYTLDPTDDPDDLAVDGWIGGHDRSWGPGFAPDGAFFGGSHVALFRTEALAALYHARQVESFRRFRGRLIEGGWTLKETVQWRVPALGPDAWGIRNTFMSKAGTFYDTEIHFRVGRIVGEIGLISSRDTDLRKAIEADGLSLLKRIKRVAGSAR
jgi:hypothetical protein